MNETERWTRLHDALDANIKPDHKEFARRMVAEDFLIDLAGRLSQLPDQPSMPELMDEYVESACRQLLERKKGPIGCG